MGFSILNPVYSVRLILSRHLSILMRKGTSAPRKRSLNSNNHLSIKMKKTIIALLALAGVVAAESITLNSSIYSNAWVYIWNPETNSWDYSTSINSQSLVTGSDYSPSAQNSDPAFIGYTFSYVNGAQILTSTDITMTASAPVWIGSKGVYLGENVTATGGDNGIRSGAKIHFCDISTSQLVYTAKVWKQGDASVTGSLTLDSDTFSHTFISVVNMQQAAGGWDFSNFTVTDANGNSLTYTTDEDYIGKAGYFWVEESAFTQGAAYSATLVAKAIPEPTTATLSLLTLVGLAARRRRK